MTPRFLTLDSYKSACRTNTSSNPFIIHVSTLAHWHINYYGSVIFPFTAAAAATRGPAKMVRAPGPCRPSKLRLEVETAYFPAGILSSFIARHAEHPGWRS